MAQTNVAPNFDAAQSASVELDSNLMGQLNEILENADSAESTKHQDTSYWHYSVPMAGVRYYSDEAPSSQPRASHRVNSR